MTVGEGVEGADTLFGVRVLWSWFMLSPAADESVCEIDPALPSAHWDTTASEALLPIMREPVIMMIDGFTWGDSPTIQRLYIVFLCEAISRIV